VFGWKVFRRSMLADNKSLFLAIGIGCFTCFWMLMNFQQKFDHEIVQFFVNETMGENQNESENETKVDIQIDHKIKTEIDIRVGNSQNEFDIQSLINETVGKDFKGVNNQNEGQSEHEKEEIQTDHKIKIKTENQVENKVDNFEIETETKTFGDEEVKIDKKEDETSTQGFVFVNQPIGGLGDRLRGVILGFYVALLANRALKIDGHTMWGSEDDYLDANLVNWIQSKEEEEIIRSPTTSRISFVDFDFVTVKYDQINFDDLKQVKVISIAANVIKLNLLAENPTLKTRPKFEFFNELHQKGLLYSHALKSLFKPGKKVFPHLEKIQSEYWPTNDTLRIGMHLRSGDNGRLTSNSRRRKKRAGRYATLETAECYALKAISIWEEKKKELNEYKNVIFFISADLVDLEEIVMKKIESHGYKIFRNNNLGEARHIDKTATDQIRTFVDWWTLVNVDIILLPNSGFSESASKISCKPSYLFFDNDGPCEQLFTPYIDNGFCHKIYDQTFLLNAPEQFKSITQ